MAARLFERIRRMQARFDALCQRIEAGYAAVPEAEGLAEIDAAVAEPAPGADARPGVMLESNVASPTRTLLASFSPPGALSGGHALRLHPG